MDADERAKMLERMRERHPGETLFHEELEEVFEHVAPLLERHDDWRAARILERLCEPDRSIEFRVTWEDDAGEVRVNRGWRVQWCGVLGPYKGGLRLHPSVDLSTFKMLAFEQTLKNALTGMPQGGAKGGADFDPKRHSERERRTFLRAFGDELLRHVGDDVDVPAGDIGVGEREIGWLFGHWRRISNRWTGVITGKPAELGGSPLRPEATGYGAVHFARHALEAQCGTSLEGKRCLVSGAGNVALHAAQRLVDLGAGVHSLSDTGGTLHSARGFSRDDLDRIMEHKREPRARLGEVVGRVAGSEHLADSRPWHLGGDVAFPCATQSELDEEDARHLVENGVLLVVEGANRPLTPAAAAHLHAAGVQRAPGKAANAGGVAVSGFEQSQNAQRLTWSAEEVDRRLADVMHRIHGLCCRFGRLEGEDRVDLVRGANRAGFERVALALVAAGPV